MNDVRRHKMALYPYEHNDMSQSGKFQVNENACLQIKVGSRANITTFPFSFLKHWWQNRETRYFLIPVTETLHFLYDVRIPNRKMENLFLVCL